MASRSHVESSVNERRLRPIYDCLDFGNNKKALQEADKVLKKQKDFHCAKVLKSLALLRLSRQHEATRLLEEVKMEVPTDDPTLQAMTICFRELHRPQHIIEIYEAAVEREPQSEELLTHLFMAYVRLGEYKKQQQVALSLFKLKAKNPYYFWAIMSIVMQAHYVDENMAQKMLLPLAERMVEKFVKENKMEAEAEVHLYLMILELQHKYEDILRVLESPLGDKLTSYINFKAMKRAELLCKMEMWPETNAAYKQLILQSPDNWNFYCEYFNSALKLVELSWNKTENGNVDSLDVDFTIQMLIQFMEERTKNEEIKEKAVLRGPFLAHIHLLDLLKNFKHSTSSIENACKVSLLSSYVNKFGDRPCCFSDLKMLLFSLEDEEKKKLLGLIVQNINLQSCSNLIPHASDAKQLQHYIFFIQISRFLGEHDKLNSQEKIELSHHLFKCYKQGLTFGKNILPTDIQPCDPFCLIAVHLLIEVWKESNDLQALHQAFVLLEFALQHSPSNFQLKLLLIKLYNMTGAVSASYALYESLDIKHVQLDTLGYLISAQLSWKGLYSLANTALSNMLKFFSAKETVDYLISSYKFGSFTKIYEFVKFQERLNNSMQFAAVEAEKLIIELLESNSYQSSQKVVNEHEINPERDRPVWENVKDNRDMDIMISWDNKDRHRIEKEKEFSLNTEMTWIKMRSLLIRCIKAGFLAASRNAQSEEQQCNDTSTGLTNGTKNNDLDLLRNLTNQLKDLSTVELNPLPLLKNYPIQAPEFSRLYSYQRGPYISTILDLFELLIELRICTERAFEDSDTKNCQEKMRSKIPKKVEDCIAAVIELAKRVELTEPENMAKILEDLSNVTEMFGFLTIIAGFCQKILNPIMSSIKKNKKKKETKVVETPKLVDAYNFMIDNLNKSAADLSKSIQTLQTDVLTEEINLMNIGDGELCSSVIENQDLPRDISKKIIKSYQQSLKEIGDIVQNKIKYISTIKL